MYLLLLNAAKNEVSPVEKTTRAQVAADACRDGGRLETVTPESLGCLTLGSLRNFQPAL